MRRNISYLVFDAVQLQPGLDLQAVAGHRRDGGRPVELVQVDDVLLEVLLVDGGRRRHDLFDLLLGAFLLLLFLFGLRLLLLFGLVLLLGPVLENQTVQFTG